MKIDRKRPSHWMYLVLTGLNGLVALILRPLVRPRRGRPPLIVLYGHKLNGNLLALYRQMRESRKPAWRPVFLTMDPVYYRQLRAEGIDCVLSIHPSGIWLLAKAVAVISDHGLHSLQLILGRGKLRFFDVWHGIPFKGFNAHDFRVQHRYDQVWVASPMLAQMYVEKFGFLSSRVKVTGYARTDYLVKPCEDRIAVRARLGLPPHGPIILFAPTWAQDDAGRSIFPFGATCEAFLGALANLAESHGATVVLRTHLNSGSVTPGNTPRILTLPTAKEPDTESILSVSDVLVCDWSSIAFDYLLLERPTVFLDVPAPFRNGFSLGSEYRYGAIATDLKEMLCWIDMSLREPQIYWKEHRARHLSIRQAVYGEFADGHAAERCLQHMSSYVEQRV